MRRASVALAAALASAAMNLGCYATTWRELGPGEAAKPGMVAVTGTLRFEPPLELYGPGGYNVVLVGPMRDHVLAYFSDNLKGSFQSGQHPPFPDATTAWLPMEGPFAVELPPNVRYLRGFAYVTNRGSSFIELPMRFDLRPGDRAVEVGTITVIRTPPRKAVVRPTQPGGRSGAVVRLADPGL